MCAGCPILLSDLQNMRPSTPPFFSNPCLARSLPRSACSVNMGTVGEGSVSARLDISWAQVTLAARARPAQSTRTTRTWAQFTRVSASLAQKERTCGRGQRVAKLRYPPQHSGRQLAPLKRAALYSGKAVREFLEQNWAEGGWEITTALALVCTSIVERCVIDAMASKNRVIWVNHGLETYSNFVGLAIRGVSVYESLWRRSKDRGWVKSELH